MRISFFSLISTAFKKLQSNLSSCLAVSCISTIAVFSASCRQPNGMFVRIGFAKYPTSTGFFFLVLPLILAFTFFVRNIIAVGEKSFYIANRSGKPSILQMFFGFQNAFYLPLVKKMLSMTLEIAFYTLLFIVPGIIKALQLFLVPCLLAENPALEYSEAKQRSAEMMNGHKGALALFLITFILAQALMAFVFALFGRFMSSILLLISGTFINAGLNIAYAEFYGIKRGWV